MPESVAAEKRRLSYGTRAVRFAFTDKAPAKWIASRLRRSVGGPDLPDRPELGLELVDAPAGRLQRSVS